MSVNTSLRNGIVKNSAVKNSIFVEPRGFKRYFPDVQPVSF
jgi:hypothetical protein